MKHHHKISLVLVYLIVISLFSFYFSYYILNMTPEERSRDLFGKTINWLLHEDLTGEASRIESYMEALTNSQETIYPEHMEFLKRNYSDSEVNTLKMGYKHLLFQSIVKDIHHEHITALSSSNVITKYTDFFRLYNGLTAPLTPIKDIEPLKTDKIDDLAGDVINVLPVYKPEYQRKDLVGFALKTIGENCVLSSSECNSGLCTAMTSKTNPITTMTFCVPCNQEVEFDINEGYFYDGDGIACSQGVEGDQKKVCNYDHTCQDWGCNDHPTQIKCQQWCLDFSAPWCSKICQVDTCLDYCVDTKQDSACIKETCDDLFGKPEGVIDCDEAGDGNLHKCVMINGKPEIQLVEECDFYCSDIQDICVIDECQLQNGFPSGEEFCKNGDVVTCEGDGFNIQLKYDCKKSAAVCSSDNNKCMADTCVSEIPYVLNEDGSKKIVTPLQGINQEYNIVAEPFTLCTGTYELD